MRVAVTGARGQLGGMLVKTLSGELNIIPLSRNDMDITKLNIVKKVLGEIRPDCVIHCAAFTTVDECEDKPDLAYLINAVGTKNVALSCSEINSSMMYISSTYVFDGTKNTPYTEFDTPCPNGVYAKSKYAGECYVKDLLTRFYIIRTGWLYGNSKKGFIDFVIDSVKNGRTINVVDDLYGTPTYVKDLCCPIKALLMDKNYGIYHITNSGMTDRVELAKAIFNILGRDVPINIVQSLPSSRVARPHNTIVRNMMLELYGYPLLRPWQEALSEYINANL